MNKNLLLITATSIYLPKLKFVGQSNFELSAVAQGYGIPTNRPTWCAKQYAPPSSTRGIIKVTNNEFCITLITLLIFNINFSMRDIERFWMTYHSLLNVSLLSKSVFSKSKTCENIPWKIGKPHQSVHTSMVYDEIWKSAKFQILTDIRQFTWNLDIRRLDKSSKTQGLGGDRFASYSKDGKAQTIIWSDYKMLCSGKHEKTINFRHDGRNFI